MESFSLWLESKEKQWVYHISYLKDLPGIFNSKLIPKGGTSAWFEPKLQKHSEKGVFFSTNKKSSNTWYINKSSRNYQMNQSDFINTGLLPVYIRFKINRNTWTKDLESYTTGDYYTKKSIDPKGIQVWDGTEWNNNYKDAIGKILVAAHSTDIIDRSFSDRDLPGKFYREPH